MSKKSLLDSVIKKHWIFLFVLLIFQIIFCLIVSWFLSKFSLVEDSTFHVFEIVRLVALIVLAVIFLFLDVLFYYLRIFRLNKLRNATPLPCTVEDFFVFSYTDEGTRKYRVFPLVKCNTDGKYYFTYGNMSLSWFTLIRYQAISYLADFTIIRGDKSKVLIGDRASAYIYKTKSDRLDYDSQHDKLYLNNVPIRNFAFHTNKQIDSSIIRSSILFVGAIDIE